MNKFYFFNKEMEILFVLLEYLFMVILGRLVWVLVLMESEFMRFKEIEMLIVLLMKGL